MNTIAIDLGTFNTAAAVRKPDGSVVTAVSSDGPSLTGKSFPSFMSFNASGNLLSIGEVAKRGLVNKPALVVWGIKRFVGLSYSEARKRGLFENLDFHVEEGADDRIVIRVGPKCYQCEELIEMFLKAVKADVENADANPELLGAIYSRVIITHPADYNAVRVGCIVEAAKRVFEVVDTVAEPTAAAICHGLATDSVAKVMAFDLGAGTLDVSIVRLTRRNGVIQLTERGVSGHEALGGMDMDRSLLKALKPDPDFMKDGREQLKDAALLSLIENAKIALSESETTCLAGRSTYTLTRARLEQIIAPLVARMCIPIIHALEAADMKAAELDHIFMVGGPTKMPCVRKFVADTLQGLGARPSVVEEARNPSPDVDPMECVARGAAMKPAELDTTMPEGFGILLGGSYQNMIHPGSAFPTKSAAKHLSPMLEQKRRSMSVHVALKMRDPNTHAMKFRYADLGEFPLHLNPAYASDVSVHLEVSAQKALAIRLVQTEFQSNQATYSGANLLLLGDLPIDQEDKQPELPPELRAIKEHAERSGRPFPGLMDQDWSHDQHQELILLAAKLHKSASALARPPADLAASLGQLKTALSQAASANGRWKETTFTLSNRLSETLHDCRVHKALPAAELDALGQEFITIKS